MMEKKKIKSKYPSQLAWLIIISSLSQVIGGNASFIDTVLKLGIIGVFSLIAIKGRDVLNISVFFMAYIFLFLLSNLSTIIVNKVGIVSGIIEVFTVLLLFFLFCEKPKNINGATESDIMQFYKLYAYFMLFACVYSMIINIGSLTNIFSLSLYAVDEVRSIFDNKNTFGMYLLFGSLACMFLHAQTKEKKWLQISALFILNELMAMCRTAMLLSVAIFIVSLVVTRKHPVRNIVLVAIASVFVLLIIEKVPVLNSYFFGNVFGNVDSMDTRAQYIENMLPLIRERYALVGYGTEKAITLAAVYTGNKYYHNTYLYLTISGGLFKLLLFALIVLKSAATSARVLKKDRVLGIMLLVSIVCYLVYAYIESFALFDTPVISMVATIFAVSMPILFEKALSGNANSYKKAKRKRI